MYMCGVSVDDKKVIRWGWGCVYFFQAKDGIRDLVRSRGLGDVYKRQARLGADAGAGLPHDDPGGRRHADAPAGVFVRAAAAGWQPDRQRVRHVARDPVARSGWRIGDDDVIERLFEVF